MKDTTTKIYRDTYRWDDGLTLNNFPTIKLVVEGKLRYVRGEGWVDLRERASRIFQEQAENSKGDGI